MMKTWESHSTSNMNTSVTEYTSDLPDGYGLQVHRYRTYVTNNFINEWAVWEKNWLNVKESGVCYGSLDDGKKAAEQAHAVIVADIE